MEDIRLKEVDEIIQENELKDFDTEVSVIAKYGKKSLEELERHARINAGFHDYEEDSFADKKMIGKMMALGIPASFQNILIALSEMMIQSHVNLFPNEVIAGIGVANKVAIWVRLPMQSISVILTNYVGQNLGAKEYERVQKGIEICNMIGVAITLVCCIVVCGRAISC